MPFEASRISAQRFLARNLAGFLTGVFGLFIIFKDLLTVNPAKFLWADQYDSPLIYWIVNWGYFILFKQGDPSQFWHANSFYPQPFTLAYSDSLISLQLFFAPLRALGIDALISLYLSLAITILCACLLTQSALNQIGNFSPLEVAFIVFGAHFSLSITGFLPHYQLFGFQLVPPFLLYVYIYLRDLRFSSFVVVCLLYIFGVGFATYLAPILLILVLFLAPPFILYQFAQGRLGKEYWKRDGWRSLIAGGVFALGLYLILLRPYVYANDLLPKESMRNFISYSAMPYSIFWHKSLYSYIYETRELFPGKWEIAYFPGYLLLFLGFSYLFIIGIRLMRSLVLPDWKSSLKQLGGKIGILFSPDTSIITYLVIFFFLTWFLSWGPFLRLYPESESRVRLPYYYLARLVPGLDSIRAPGRFGMFIGLPLAVMGVMLIRDIPVINLKMRRILLAIALFALVVESLPRYLVFPFDPDPEKVYAWVTTQISPGTPILELPIASWDHDETIRIATGQLVGSTIHWGKIPAGYGAKVSPEYSKLLEADRLAQGNPPRIGRLLQLAERYKIEYLLVHLEKYSPQAQNKWKELFSSCGGERYESAGEVILINLRDCYSRIE